MGNLGKFDCIHRYDRHELFRRIDNLGHAIDLMHTQAMSSSAAPPACPIAAPWRLALVIVALGTALLGSDALAHNVAESDGAFVSTAQGVHFGVFAYLGGKHMITGADHLLFLAGVVFYLRRLADVALFATLFALGHSLTLLAGVLAGWQLNSHGVDAVIALSVIYKALHNLGTISQGQSTLRYAVFAFGLAHGLGLATKLQDLSLDPAAIVPNMLGFNLGVELGQLLALGALWLALGFWRHRTGFAQQGRMANWLILIAGLVLLGDQLTPLLVNVPGAS